MNLQKNVKLSTAITVWLLLMAIEGWMIHRLLTSHFESMIQVGLAALPVIVIGVALIGLSVMIGMVVFSGRKRP